MVFGKTPDFGAIYRSVFQPLLENSCLLQLSRSFINFYEG